MEKSNLIKKRAQELIEQHGDKAIQVANSKIDNFPKDSYSREKDFALMVLTEVEKLSQKASI